MKRDGTLNAEHKPYVVVGHCCESGDLLTPAPDEPEVLTLTHLKFGQGLPASRLEIEIIERTRQKRVFDQMLPPPTDEYGFTLRSKLMEEQDAERIRLSKARREADSKAAAVKAEEAKLAEAKAAAERADADGLSQGVPDADR